MDSSTFQTDALPILTECGKLLDRASGLINGKNAIVLIESEGMFPDLLYAFNKLVRKLPPQGGIDLVLHSLGGTIDTASAIASICRERFGSFRVIVPFMAKSAATMLALAADDRLLTTSAQLGPFDPLVRHPERREMWFPAHSIREALARVESTKDPIVKMAMADKLDPLLIGAFQDAISVSKQYIEEVVDGWSGVDKETIVSAFTDKYKSHGYPIGGTILRSLNVPYTPIDGETESVICDLHEKCVDLLEAEEPEDGAIILTKDEYLFRAGDFKESGKFTTIHPHLALPTNPPPAKTTAGAS